MRRVAGTLLAGAALALATTSDVAAAPGDLDAGFSKGGLSTSDKPATSAFVARQSQGRVLVASGGNRGPGTTTYLTVRRLRSSGSVDPDFGEPPLSGRTVVRFCGAPVGISSAPDESIYVASTECLVKLTPDGVLDPTFSGDGVVPVYGATDVTSDAAGRPLVTGLRSDPFLDAYVARYLATGAADASFGTTGESSIPAFRFSPPSLAAVSSGIYVGGESDDDPAVARLDPDGALDPAFGDAGVATIDVGPGLQGETSSVAATPSSVFLGGTSTDGDLVEGIVGKLDSSGNPASGFGNGGLVRLTPKRAAEQVNRVAVRQDGGLLAVGSSGNPCSGRDGLGCLPQSSGTVWALDPGGAVDESFGVDGRAEMQLNGQDSFADGLIGADETSLLASGTTELACCERPPHALVAQLELTQGPADPDADGFVGDNEACPYWYATNARGCPRYESKMRVRETLWKRERFFVVVEVESRGDVCVAGPDPVLEVKKAGSGWRRAKGIEKYVLGPGKFEFDGGESNGRYRLVLKRADFAGRGECSGDIVDLGRH